MLRKLEKTKRYWGWRFRPSNNVPLFWHVGRPNFGDDINPSFFDNVGDRPIRFAIDRSQPHLLGIGSILESATASSIVVGAGYLNPVSGRLPEQATVISVRGRRTLDRIGGDDRILLGDPLVLVDTLFDKPIKKKYGVGLVAHVLNVKRMNATYCRHAHVISPAMSPWKVVEEIASCEQIVSQSLHGLIVADAMGVPNVWLAPSESMVGGRFKFDDYFTTLDNAKPMIGESEDVFRRPSRFPFSVSQYKYSKRKYRMAITNAIASFSSATRDSGTKISEWQSRYSLTK